MKVFFEVSQLNELGSAHDVIEANGFALIGLFEKSWVFAGKLHSKQLYIYENEKNGKKYFQKNFNKYGSFEMKIVKNYDSYYNLR